MPKADSKTSITGDISDDRNINYQTTLTDGEQQERPPLKDDEDEKPNFPPESFWLSKDAEFDWFDRNAFFERKESTKASSHSTNLNPNLNLNPHPQSNSNSQRFSLNLKSKASIIGLPKPQNTTYVDAKNRRNCKSGNIRLFPKRSGSGGKSVSSMVEPSSPKVSCIGKVRSKKDRNRRKSHRRQHSSSEPSTEKEKPDEKSKRGFFASFRAIFRSGGRRQPVVKPAASLIDSPLEARDVTRSSDVNIRRKSMEIEPPVLGGLNRFASGRRSSSWAGIDDRSFDSSSGI